MASDKKKFVSNKIIPFLKNHNPLDIFLDEELYLEYCKIFNYPVNIKNLPLDPRYRKMREHLGQIKSRSARAIEKVSEIQNQVLVQKVKSVKTKEVLVQKMKPLKTKPKTKDIFGKEKTPANITIQETEIKSEYKNIKKVSFSSPATRNTIEKLETQTKVLNHITKDYCYYLQGGTEATEEVFVEKMIDGKKSIQKVVRNRYQFPSLILRDRFQKKVQEIMQNPNLMTINKETLDNLKRQFDVAVKIDQAPLEFINKLTEGGFNMQKELQGAILNDKAMIENGIVELESQVSELDNNGIPQSIKEIFDRTEIKTFGNIENNNE